MAEVHMMVGLPGSGKSTKAKELVIEKQALYLSSDELRKELFANANVQEDVIFATLEKRMLQTLSTGTNVVYDATNMSRRRRIHLISTLKRFDVVGHVMLTDYEESVKRDSERKIPVGEAIVLRMYKNFQFPFKWEGFSNVNYYVQNKTLNIYKDEFENVLNTMDYNELFDMLCSVNKEFRRILEMPQDSTYHSFSVSRHIYHVYMNAIEKHFGAKKQVMVYAALFHDLGKGLCKSFINLKGETTRYANFLGHENVSALLAYECLNNFGYAEEFVLEVVQLISLHMLPKQATEKTFIKIEGWIGKEDLEALMLFNDYDNEGK